MTVPQQVDEAEPLPVSKTLTTTPLPDQAIRDAISKFMPRQDPSGSVKSGRSGRFFTLRLS